MPRRQKDSDMLPWLMTSLDEESFGDLLAWTDDGRTSFQVAFQHGNSRKRGQRTQEQAAAVWTAWAQLKNKCPEKIYGSKEKPGATLGQWLTTCRQRFRQALKSLVNRRYLEVLPSSTQKTVRYRILDKGVECVPSAGRSADEPSLPAEESPARQSVDEDFMTDLEGNSTFQCLQGCRGPTVSCETSHSGEPTVPNLGGPGGTLCFPHRQPHSFPMAEHSLYPDSPLATFTERLDKLLEEQPQGSPSQLANIPEMMEGEDVFLSLNINELVGTIE